MIDPENFISFVEQNRSLFLNALRYRTHKQFSYFSGLTESEIAAGKFLSMNTAQSLFRMSGLYNFHELEHCINHPGYKTYTVSKKSGGVRKITAPDPILKGIQRNLNFYLQHYYNLIGSENATGFIRKNKKSEAKSGIVYNAELHVKNQVVLNLDISNFFGSISAKRIYELFKSSYFQFTDEIATALTLLFTYEGFLPTGAPTSPVLSNFICLQLDSDLNKFAEANQLTYSRYADDIIFSGKSFITDTMKKELTSILTNNGFKINEKKWRIRSKNQKQLVTGLVVNEKVNIDRKFIRKVRAMIFDLKKNGIDQAAAKHFKSSRENSPALQDKFMNRLSGYVDFIGQVRGREDAIYNKFKWDIVPFGMTDA